MSGAQTPRWRLEQGDALTLLRAMPDASVDAIVTDPPYSSGGMTRGDRTSDTGSKYVMTKSKTLRADFAGDNRDQRSFGYWVALWLSECLRVAKPGAPICMFTDWRQLPTVTDAIQAGGWIWRGLVPWDKTEKCRPSMGRFAAQCEYVTVASPEADPDPDAHERRLVERGVLDRDVLVWGSAGAMPEARGVGCLWGCFRVPIDFAEKHHQTGKPVELMRKANAICEPGGVILDPFAGSGSTGVAALRDGYRFIGFEKTEAYAAVARKWLAAEEQGLTLAAAESGQMSLLAAPVRS